MKQLSPLRAPLYVAKLVGELMLVGASLLREILASQTHVSSNVHSISSNYI